MPTVRWRQDQTECVFSCSPRNLTPKNLDIKSLIWSLASLWCNIYKRSMVIKWIAASLWMRWTSCYLLGSLRSKGNMEPSWATPKHIHTNATNTSHYQHIHPHTHSMYRCKLRWELSNLWKPQWLRWERRAQPWRGTQKQPGKRGPVRRWLRRQTGLFENTPAKVYLQASVVQLQKINEPDMCFN